MKAFAGKALLFFALVLAAPFAVRYYQWVLSPPQPNVESGAPEDSALGVKDLIRRVKQELREAETERLRNDEASLFELDYFDLEINFVVRNRVGVSSSVEPQFIVVSNETELTSERVQKIRLHLKADFEEAGAGVVTTGPFRGDIQDLTDLQEGDSLGTSSEGEQ